jgi:hypothetical protein
MVERSYLSLAGAASQPENRCLKRKLSIRHADSSFSEQKSRFRRAGLAHQQHAT